jgi:hypothetical protein
VNLDSTAPVGLGALESRTATRNKNIWGNEFSFHVTCVSGLMKPKIVIFATFQFTFGSGTLNLYSLLFRFRTIKGTLTILHEASTFQNLWNPISGARLDVGHLI